MALCYLATLVRKNPPSLFLAPLNIHRLLLTAILLAAKFTDDHYFNTAFYARVGVLCRPTKSRDG